MARSVTRRRFIQGSAAAAATAGLEPGFARALEPGELARIPDGPNILLVIIDSLRADAVYDDWVRTPNITELARQGIRFTHVFPEGMPTVPARNGIFSGRRQFPFRGWYDRPGMISSPGWEPIERPDLSMLAMLRRAGWWTSYVSDNPFLCYAPGYTRFRHSVNRYVRTGGQIGGRRHPSSVPDHILRHWLHPANDDAKTRARVGLYLANSRPWEGAEKTFAGRVFRNALQELDSAAARRRPFALVVDTYEPHEPWTPPKRFLDMYGGWRGPEPSHPTYGRVENWLTPSQRGPVTHRMRDLYAAEVTLTDYWLGNLLERLHDLNLERETVIALVSDHGIMLGEHGWTGKVQTALYPALTRVPLILVHPGRRRAGQASDFFASTHDLGPTLLRMAGVRRPDRMNGVDLSRPFRGRKLPERDYAWGGYSDSFFIRSRRWMLWGYNRPGNFRLFDLKRDPGMEHNVAGRYPGTVNDLLGKIVDRAGGRLPWYGGQ
jgi:arylsulfatase A-like enzyme